MPSTTARAFSLPISRWRTQFSTITIAWSTTIPSTSTRPKRALPSSDLSVRRMKMNVVANVTGMPITTTRAARHPRNTHSEASTSTIPSIALVCSRRMMSLMKID